MKKIFAAIGLVAMLACSCNRHHEPEYPEPTYLGDFNAAQVLYYGDYYENGCDNYIVRVISGPVSSDLTLTGSGLVVYLDINAPQSKYIGLPSGTYSPLYSGDRLEYKYVRGGTEGTGNVTGSYICRFIGASDNGKAYEIADGDIKVSYRGSLITIEGIITAAGVDYDFYYSGPVDVVDKTENTDDVDKTWSIAEACNYGDYYGVGADNWFIMLSNADYDSTGECVNLEINANSTDGSLPTGTFKIVDGTVKPGMGVAGWIDDENGGYIYGTWYCYDEVGVYGATEGTISISAKGRIYTITYNCYDSIEKGSFSGTYTGTLDYFDPDSVETKVGDVLVSTASIARGKHAVGRRLTR